MLSVRACAKLDIILTHRDREKMYYVGPGKNSHTQPHPDTVRKMPAEQLFPRLSRESESLPGGF